MQERAAAFPVGGVGMSLHDVLLSRKDFLLAVAATALASGHARAVAGSKKALAVVAHPDDEYAFAANLYRLVRELGWTADQVVITNGEAGYRYSSLAEAFYGVALSDDINRRAHLPAIRKDEARRAGKVLGIRHHYFQDQKDLGFTDNASSADSSNWDRPGLMAFLTDLLHREQYDVVFTLLPTCETHGHHRAATLLALEAVSRLPGADRPLVFGADAGSTREASPSFDGLRDYPITATVSSSPALVFSRTERFGYHNALDYQIVVNWVIAEHKSQGLFQMDSERHDVERLWAFQVSGAEALRRLADFEDRLGNRAAHLVPMRTSSNPNL